MQRRPLVALASWLAFTGGFACRSPAPPPIASCVETCQAKIASCDEHDCRRGCDFILDRLIEHEETTVLACAAKRRGACDDDRWAECASMVGLHADGGPPVPTRASPDDEVKPPPSTEDDDDDLK